jgi:uncharacterized protein YndB with AHSA1/START domain
MLREGTMPSQRVYEIFIEAPPEAVYDYVSDVARHVEWAANRIEVEHISGERAQPGTTYRYATHFLQNAAGVLTVTRADPPRVFSYRCEEASGTFGWTFDITGEGNGTRLKHIFQPMSLSLQVRLFMPVLRPLFGDKQVNGGLANIKEKLEAPADTPA